MNGGGEDVETEIDATRKQPSDVCTSISPAVPIQRAVVKVEMVAASEMTPSRAKASTAPISPTCASTGCAATASSTTAPSVPHCPDVLPRAPRLLPTSHTSHALAATCSPPPTPPPPHHFTHALPSTLAPSSPRTLSQVAQPMLDEKTDASALVLESNDDVVHDETTPSAEKEEVAQQETCLAPATAKAPHHRIRPHPLLPPLPPPPLPLPSQPYTASVATIATSYLRCTCPPTASRAFSVQLGSSFAATPTALPCSRATLSFCVWTDPPLQQSCPNKFTRYALRTSCLRCLGLSSLASGLMALWRRWRRRPRCSRTLWSVLRWLRCMRADALSLTPLATASIFSSSVARTPQAASLLTSPHNHIA